MSEGASSLYIPLASGVTDCAVLDQFLVTLLRKMRPDGRCSNKSSPNGAKSDGERFPLSETQVESGVAHALKRFSVFDDDGDNWVNPVSLANVLVPEPALNGCRTILISGGFTFRFEESAISTSAASSTVSNRSRIPVSWCAVSVG